MARYVFILEEATGTYPERYRVLREGEDGAALVAAEGLTGAVGAGEWQALFSRLQEKCPVGEGRRAESAYGSSWAAIERSYAGLFRA